MTNFCILRPEWSREASDPESLLSREWLVTNGLGGFAAGTIAGVATRRYHGLLTAALPAPFGRQLTLDHLSETIQASDGETYRIGGTEWKADGLEVHGVQHIKDFCLEWGLPVWRYEMGGMTLEKRILVPHRQNSIQVQYRLLSGDVPVRLRLRVALNFRPHDALVSRVAADAYKVLAINDRYEIHGRAGDFPLRLFLYGEQAALTLECRMFRNVLYRLEEQRGYEAEGDLWSPGYFHANLARESDVILIASAENWQTILALKPHEVYAADLERRQRLVTIAHPEAQADPARNMILAADQFIVTPAERIAESTRARAAGEEARTIIAGYHWFTDWGRDTMISLEGLTLTTGRSIEAGYILRTFARYIRDGLIPNMFPEGEEDGQYNTADATLWYFHSLERYLDAATDRFTLRILLPKLLEIIDHHLRGTRFGIAVDPEDGLLRQGESGYALTWMDAKMGDWVVTPRRGKAVEINALWYNALRLLERWVHDELADEVKAAHLAMHAERTRDSFNRRFWNPEAGCLYDVVDGESGDDPSCRPNQILAISLRNPVLDQAYWRPVMEVVRERLLTPVGLRTLSSDHPDYKGSYRGDLHSRDAAYHQGTVWPWLIGPFIDAWVKVYPEDREGARRFLQDLVVTHQHEACAGSISEIFDAEPPFTPRGCVAQAWSVAEVLRSWVVTSPRRSEARPR
jgi:predicted glycogen debranching enzyme